MNFDLNIDNYKKDELIKIFDLSQNYNKSILEAKERIIKENINNNKEITKEIKIKTINFITQAKIILLNDNNSNNNNNDNNNNETKDFQETVKEFYNSSYDLKPVTLEDPSQHMVQIQHKSPYLSSHPSEYFPGVFNPLKKKVLKKNLNIDTRFRNNYYSSSSTNFNVTLPLLINNVLSMQLSAIEMPTSYYNISKQFGNNFFSVVINGVSQVVSVSDGNYNKEGIVSAINNALTNLGGDFQYVYFFININTTENTNGSGQMMVGLKNNVPSSFNFELNFQANRFGADDRNTPLPLKFGWMLGFRNGVYVNNQNYVSEGVVDLSGPKYLFLVVDDFNNNTNNGYYSAFNSSVLNKNILARISLTSSVFSIFNENNYNIVTIMREYFGPVNIQTLNIQLLDEYGRVLELNNMDYSFSLNLTVAYDI
jgi:hypothetical protein